MEIYPNPFPATLHIRCLAQTAGPATLRVMTLQGQVLVTRLVALQPGLNELELPPQSLTKGIYLLSLTGHDFKVHKKIIKA